jgi:hypothetical protein
MHLKKVIQEKRGGPCVLTKSLYWNIFFRCIFFTKVSLYFWNLRKILHLLYPWSPYCEKKFWDLYIVHDLKCFDQRWSGHWVKTLFAFIFVTFERYVTNLSGTVVPVPISTHPTRRIQNGIRKHFRVLIRGLGAVDLWKKVQNLVRWSL